MRVILRILGGGILALVIAQGVSAQTAFPMLMSLKPVAVQVGTTSEITVNSRYSMHNAESVLVTGGGVLGEVVPPELKPDDKSPNATVLKIKLTVAADAMPGVRDL